MTCEISTRKINVLYLLSIKLPEKRQQLGRANVDALVFK
jgi:hypothetical protein